mmetsp:Transcript_25617/g.64358  ORF Transcript_25617/g.64358 Transcript_25617/m.64358 type:complete len:83 (+) Transcript_25617:1264-1512(+)
MVPIAKKGEKGPLKMLRLPLSKSLYVKPTANFWRPSRDPWFLFLLCWREGDTVESCNDRGLLSSTLGTREEDTEDERGGTGG